MNKFNLKQLQSEFKEFLFTGSNEEKISKQITDKNSINALLRLDVYRNAYYIRLQEALAHDFPVLLKVMGEEQFGRGMAAYLQQYPSTKPSLRYIGDKLPVWFKQENKHDLSELAQLEWVILKSFDAADTDCLSAESLQVIPPEQWQQLHFSFHPSISILNVNSNLLKIWKAYHSNKTLPNIQSISPQSLVVSRTDRGPVIQPIPPAFLSLFTTLADNKPFAVACEQLSQLELEQDESNIAAQFLTRAIDNGWIASIQIDSL